MSLIENLSFRNAAKVKVAEYDYCTKLGDELQRRIRCLSNTVSIFGDCQYQIVVSCIAVLSVYITVNTVTGVLQY